MSDFDMNNIPRCVLNEIANLDTQETFEDGDLLRDVAGLCFLIVVFGLVCLGLVVAS